MRAFTLLELLIVVAVIALLLAILFPSVSAARNRGIDARCLSNQRNALATIIAFAGGHRDSPAPARIDRNGTWSESTARGWDITPSRESSGIGTRPEPWGCPETSRPFVGNCKALGTETADDSWPWTTGQVPMSRWHRPSTLVVIYDVQPDLVPGPYGAAGEPNIGDISDERVIPWSIPDRHVVFPATFDYLGPHVRRTFVVGFGDGHAAIGAFLNESDAYFWNGPRWWSKRRNPAHNPGR